MVGLPAEATNRLKEIAGLRQKLGAKLAEHTRNHSFHYPHLDNAYSPDGDEHLPAVLGALANAPGGVVNQAR